MVQGRSHRYRPDRRFRPALQAAGTAARFTVLAVVVFTLAAATGSAVADATRPGPAPATTGPLAATATTGGGGGAISAAELGAALIQFGVTGLVVSLAGMLLVVGWRHRW